MGLLMRYVRFYHSSLAGAYYGCISSEAPQQVAVLDGPPWMRTVAGDGLMLSLAEVTLLAPCTPGKIVCVGKNYRDHAAEMAGLSGDGSVPSEPLLFLKPPSAVIATAAAIDCPPESERVDYEGELALVIGRTARRVDAEAATEYIFGYTIANDVTARDLQKKDSQWTRGKGFDTFCPLGPVLVPALKRDARLVTRLNERVVQSTTVEQMVFAPEYLVAYISQIMTLDPGDVVLTGTPKGVGKVESGDVVSVEIEGIGTLTNPVVRSLKQI